MQVIFRFFWYLFLFQISVIGIIWLVAGTAMVLNILPPALLILVGALALWGIHEFFYRRLG